MENNRINNKDKKWAGGNWGHPRPFVKKHTSFGERPEVPKHLASKKYKPKKEVKPYAGHCCPFCDKELPEVVSKEQAQVFRIDYKSNKGRVFASSWGKRSRGLWSGLRSVKCKNCGAREVYSLPCPCCKRNVWYDQKTKTYKHQKTYSACGFNGQKKI